MEKWPQVKEIRGEPGFVHGAFSETKSYLYNVIEFSGPIPEKGMWGIDERGNVSIRCHGCGTLYSFNKEDVHPCGLAKAHYENHGGVKRPCYECPYCDAYLVPYFKGWEKACSKTSGGGGGEEASGGSDASPAT